ncbi:unnamed protein product [Ambrosiozyma monospora]|uniref:Unnamed protein product n=1 Tax=Ambrosiozyma monospora TaxID=43982 RepID=A0A9W6YSP5_AMBMO|nr:unnamed protein product [Ambrosiozyma monospora]
MDINTHHNKSQGAIHQQLFMENRKSHAKININLKNNNTKGGRQTGRLKSSQVETFVADGLFEACNTTEVKNERHDDAALLDEVITQDDSIHILTNNISSPKNDVEGPADLTHDANYSRDKESSVQFSTYFESFNRGRTEGNNPSPRWIQIPIKNILTVSIPEDNRFKLELPSKVNWVEFLPKLRELQLHELEPRALDSIHKAYTNLIDLKDTIHVFTTSQLLQFISIYRSFVQLRQKAPTKAYLHCSKRFKCQSTMSLKLDEEKGLFYLSYIRDPTHNHSSAEFVQMAKVQFARRLKHLNVNIIEDDRFKLELPSKVNWAEFVAKLRVPQLYELDPEALDLIHQTYTNLIDYKDTIHVFTTSQFLQFISTYRSFVNLSHKSKYAAFLCCPARFKCMSTMTLKLDAKKGRFYLSCTSGPFHTHTSSDIVDMVKLRFEIRSKDNYEQNSNKCTPMSARSPELQCFPVGIPENNRFKLELPSKVNWVEFLPKLRELQRHELEPRALDSIHKTYTNLIDLKDTIHVFTTSQLLQFISIYRSFVQLRQRASTKAHLQCSERFKCQSTMSLKLDEEKGLFYLSYIRDPTHNHSSAEVVQMAKVQFARRLKHLNVNIIEDDRFKLELPSKVNWAEFVAKLRVPQLYELEPEALDLIHQTYINLIDYKDTIHVFTTSQFLQFFMLYQPFMIFRVPYPTNCYLNCSYRFKCKASMSLKVDIKKGLFYLSYTCEPIHTHSAVEFVEMAKVIFAKQTGFATEQADNAEDEDRHTDEFNVGNGNGNNQALRVHSTSRPVTLSFSSRGVANSEGELNPDHKEPVQILVEDDEYVFSDHESLDHGSRDDDEDNVNCNNNENSQEFHTYTGTGPMGADQIARISEVTRSLLFEQERFANFAVSTVFQQKLEGVLYYAKRLKNSYAHS